MHRFSHTYSSLYAVYAHGVYIGRAAPVLRRDETPQLLNEPLTHTHQYLRIRAWYIHRMCYSCTPPRRDAAAVERAAWLGLGLGLLTLTQTLSVALLIPLAHYHRVGRRRRRLAFSKRREPKRAPQLPQLQQARLHGSTGLRVHAGSRSGRASACAGLRLVHL